MAKKKPVPKQVSPKRQNRDIFHPTEKRYRCLSKGAIEGVA
ncbi:MAG: hypothetical protein AB1861_26315 [Cyanobacteriota bacterium]